MPSPVSPEIEKYAAEHTGPPPRHLEELIRFTYDEMSSPGMLSGPIEGTLLQILVWAADAPDPRDRVLHRLQRPDVGGGLAA